MNALLLTSHQKARFFQQLDAVLHERTEDAAVGAGRGVEEEIDGEEDREMHRGRIFELQRKRAAATAEKGKNSKRKHNTTANGESLQESKSAGLLQGAKVHIVPIGPDVSRKRVKIWQDMVARLGGIAVGGHGSEQHSEQQRRRDMHPVANHDKSSSSLVNWDDVKIVVASAQLDYEKVKSYYQCDLFPPREDVKAYSPEWLMHLVREKKFPDQDTFEWSHAKQEIEQNMKHQRELEEAQAAAVREQEDEGDESEPETEIKHAPPVNIDMDKIRREEEELQIQKDKLVKERTPIFFQNNPGFKPIVNDDDERSLKAESFVCQKSSNPLKELIKYLHAERDIWREYMYKKVVSSLKAMRTRVRSARDLQGLWWAKGRLREKVVELLETGKLAKLEAKKVNPRLKSLVEMSRIWGVGPATAAKFYNMGFKTLDELRKNGDSVLSNQQKIGFKHYDDFLKKIPRAEVTQIEKTVVDEVHRLIPNATAVACGSYRRGKLVSENCDVLVTDLDNEESDILPELLHRLHASGFITDDLTHVPEHRVGRCASYMGVCRVSTDLPHRRLDIRIYPRACFGFAMLYFTGSDHFNRSMRLFARKKGWNLSDRNLMPVDRVNGKEICKGDTVVCTSEVDVFIALDLEYKDPQERNCFDIRFLDEDKPNANKE
uniref:DNA polymerase n=1 Tax=Globisporangium ultimum (strain ATCC 200006 / CBS 805.95 / DAOM BR144) TaxID=431595 RepID=K3WBD7_GLOUD